MESFEYAIRKDGRNNQIVREVDAARQREQWRWTGIAAVLVTVLLALAWQAWQVRWQGYALEDLKRDLAKEVERGRRLRLEIDTLQTPKHIEEMATRRLHLVRPGRDEAVIIERVVPADAPANSVVARR